MYLDCRAAKLSNFFDGASLESKFKKTVILGGTNAVIDASILRKLMRRIKSLHSRAHMSDLVMFVMPWFFHAQNPNECAKISRTS